jgi:DNA-binding response OmpR family regulator
MFYSCLTDEGFAVKAITQVQNASIVCERWIPDVVLLDITLYDIDLLEI